MPKVSVIIPNYNHAPYLEKRIQSILEQTYQDFEIIFLDDASTDNSREVFAQFADHPKIRAIFNEKNSGSPFKQWNKGVKDSSGHYIWLAESDDYNDPKFLETLVPILDNHPQVGLAYCQSWQVDSQGHQLDTLHHWTNDLSKERWRTDYLNSGLDECKNYLSIKNIIPNASAVLFKKFLFEKIGYAEESMFLCGDWITWIRLLMQSDIAYLAEPLNYFRFHNSSVRSKSVLEGKDIFERMKLFDFLCQELDLSPEIKQMMTDTLMREWVSRMMLKDGIRSSRFVDFYKLSKSFCNSAEMKIIQVLVENFSFRFSRKVKQVICQF